MTNSKTVYGGSVALLERGAAALALVALLTMIACGGPAMESAPSPTPPSGMFSTLPTTEPPVVGDQPPTIELNTPEPTYTPQPTPTPNPTYTPVPTPTPNPTYTPVPTPTSNPTGTSLPTPVPTPDPTATPTPNPVATPQPTYTPEPTYTPVPLATDTAYPMPTPTPKAGPVFTCSQGADPTPPSSRGT